MLGGFGKSVRPSPRKRKRPRKQRACPAAGSLRPGRPCGGRARGSGTCPAAPPRHPSRPRKSPAGAPARDGGAAGLAPSPSYSAPLSRGRGAFTPPPPESLAAAAVSSRPADWALTWFKSSHRHAQPPGSAPWSRFHQSLAESEELGETRKEAITHWPSERGGREKNNSLAASLPLPSPSDSRTTPIRLKYTECKRDSSARAILSICCPTDAKSPAKSVINFRTQRKITVVHR